MDIIRLLPDAVANQIAAGEVIQRPASVIKELMENAIDAGATHIQVVVKNAGRTAIQVVDNGKGMSETDARMAFERHATSKITDAHDLFSLRTMGFRGEALASIAAVADVELRTRPQGAEMGTFIEIAASTVMRQEPTACPEGTQFLVKNLFFNVPARRKFLKSDDTEMRQIIQEFQRIVLVYPNIHFELINGTEPVYDLPVANTKQRINAIFGKKTRDWQQQLVPIEAHTTLGNISGFVGKPEYAQKSANQFFFVNGRFMRHPYFHRAVMQAYERMLQPNENPAYFIYFEMNPAEIDVNIHPTKTEIKFENERDIWSILMICVKESLGKFNIMPTIDFDAVGQNDLPTVGQHPDAPQPRVELHPGYNPFHNGAPSSTFSRPKNDSWQQLYEHQHPQTTQTTAPIDATEIAAKPDATLFAHTDEVSDTLFYKGRFLLTPVKSGLMVIDCRRATERITYENLLHQLEMQQCATQRTLFPETLELTADDDVLMQSLLPDLKALGFELESLGQNAYSVNGVPALITDEPDVLGVLHGMLARAKEQDGALRTQLFEPLAYEVAKSAARTKPITTMGQQEAQQLIAQLFACQNPNTTPDGRTIVSIVSDGEIEKRFGN